MTAPAHFAPRSRSERIRTFLASMCESLGLAEPAPGLRFAELTTTADTLRADAMPSPLLTKAVEVEKLLHRALTGVPDDARDMLTARAWTLISEAIEQARR